ncbi:MAG: hypothetical protein ACPL3B_05080, partial [Fervidobacterium sp.]
TVVQREMKLSVAFTLNSVEEIKQFFTILQMYLLYPEVLDLEKRLQELKSEVEKEMKTLEELKEKKSSLLKNIKTLEAKMTEKPEKRGESKETGETEDLLKNFVSKNV